MPRVKRSEYIKYSRVIIRKLYSEGCFGEGSLYEETLLRSLPDKSKAKTVLDALIKQQICLRKKKKHGWKYYLNRKMLDKIKEMRGEKGGSSIIPVLLCL